MNIKVLVVEDHPIAQKIASIILNGLNCDVDIAMSGAETLDLFDRNHYDLILMDVGLPDMDGMTLTSQLRQKETSANRVPIVGLTAHAGEDIRSRAIAAGMNDVFVKPLLKENGLVILNTYVTKSHSLNQ